MVEVGVAVRVPGGETVRVAVSVMVAVGVTVGEIVNVGLLVKDSVVVGVAVDVPRSQKRARMETSFVQPPHNPKAGDEVKGA